MARPLTNQELAALSPSQRAAYQAGRRLEDINSVSLPSAQALQERFQQGTSGIGQPISINFAPSQLPSQASAQAGLSQFTAPLQAPGALTPLQAQAPLQRAQGVGPEFFNQLSQQASERLRRQFFDPGGVSEQAQEVIASRGLVGSGVEQDLLRQQVYQPFAQSAQEIQSQIALQQAQEGAETERFNIGAQIQERAQQIDIGKFNAGLQQYGQELGLKVDQINRELGLEGQKLLMDLALAREGTENQKAQAQASLDAQMAGLRSQVALAEQGLLSDNDRNNVELQLRKAEAALNISQFQAEIDLQEKQFGLQKEQLGLTKQQIKDQALQAERQFGLQEQQLQSTRAAALAELMSNEGFLTLPEKTQREILSGFGSQGQGIERARNTFELGTKLSLSGEGPSEQKIGLVMRAFGQNPDGERFFGSLYGASPEEIAEAKRRLGLR